MTPDTMLALDGIEQPITEWALDYGITPDLIIKRLAVGLPVRKAITIPMPIIEPGKRLPVFHKQQKQPRVQKPKASVSQRCGRKPKLYTHHDESLTLEQWAHRSGITHSVIRSRIGVGWSIDRALTTPMMLSRSNRGSKPVEPTPTKAARQAEKAPGVVNNFAQVLGTGAGRNAQEIVDIDFHKDNDYADCIG